MSPYEERGNMSCYICGEDKTMCEHCSKIEYKFCKLCYRKIYNEFEINGYYEKSTQRNRIQLEMDELYIKTIEDLKSEENNNKKDCETMIKYGVLGHYSGKVREEIINL